MAKWHLDSTRYDPDWGVRFFFALLYSTTKSGPTVGTYSK
jgi:hypothetical protein